MWADIRHRVGLYLASWSPEQGDAALYGFSALFAALTVLFSTNSLYQQWAELAVGPYAAAALLSLGLHRYHVVKAKKAVTVVRPRPVTVPDDGGHHLTAHDESEETEETVRPVRHFGAARAWIFVAILIGATLMPLALEVAWRHAQPEVTVIEKAGHSAAKGVDPYEAVTNKKGKVLIHTPNVPTYENFFPYLPLMTVFGLPSSTKDPIRLTDARIFFSLVTMVVAGVSLALSHSPTEPKVRVLQVLTVLPTAALPLATGGDDMPVVAVLLLAMVLVQRRRPVLAGLVLGVASSMKFTAWPLAVFALLAARDKNGKRAPLQMALGLLLVMGPIVVPYIFKGPWAFFENVVLFPLGLSSVHSPAASPMPGHLLVTAFPWLHNKLQLMVGIVGCSVLAIALIRRPAVTAARACSLAGWTMLVAILFATATRIGYLLYPINFFVWAYMLRRADQVDHVELPTMPLISSEAAPIARST
jgi:Glycosyltransferase family 87